MALFDDIKRLEREGDWDSLTNQKFKDAITRISIQMAKSLNEAGLLDWPLPGDYVVAYDEDTRTNRLYKARIEQTPDGEYYEPLYALDYAPSITREQAIEFAEAISRGWVRDVVALVEKESDDYGRRAIEPFLPPRKMDLAEATERYGDAYRELAEAVT
jgi:hypothetical protein